MSLSGARPTQDCLDSNLYVNVNAGANNINEHPGMAEFIIDVELRSESSTCGEWAEFEAALLRLKDLPGISRVLIDLD